MKLSAKQRLCLGFALAVMPDDREKSRSSLLRYAVMHERQGGVVSKSFTKKMVRGLPKGQAYMIGLGVASYRIAIERPFLIVAILASVLFLMYEAIIALIQ